MSTLAHICCGPCGITVLQHLQEAGAQPHALFFNPNIQPLSEYLKRRDGVLAVCQRLGLPHTMADSLPEAEQRWPAPDRENGPEHYSPGQGAFRISPAANPAPWLAAISGREDQRCLFCWRIRLAYTAARAAARGYRAFTTSLLYSRRQDHEAIRDLGQSLAAEHGVAFMYEDYRVFWQRGIELSKAWGIYRQQYCGCIFSEYERYARDFARAALGGRG